MKALVLGYGRSGRAAEALLRKRGCEVVALDGDDAFPAVADFARAVVSPGIPLTHPWIAACRERGIPFMSELQLGCGELKRQGWKLIAVTGSKGKSSVVKVVADALNLAGRHAVPCGNYGLPVAEVATASSVPSTFASPPYAIVEVSSFMMETTELPADTFEAAAILNLQEDHLDRHGRVEVYHALKRKLLSMAKLPLEGSSTSNLQPSTFNLQPSTCSLLSGSYFDNAILRENGGCAIALMRAAGVDDATIAEAFRTFVPLPHRMNRLAEIGGVTYIDDSKATSLAALAAGVEMASTSGLQPSTSGLQPHILLIAGGLPKGDDPKAVLPTLTKRVRKVYLIGQCAEQFRSAWESSVDCEVCGTMDRAVGAAKRDAVKGEAVLLSPGTASFDQFKSYGERGDVFASLVKKGKTE